MRKIYPVSVGLLALVAGGSALYFFQRPLRSMAVRPRIAESLPGDALLLFSAPDPRQALTDLRTTDLYKIWKEEQVQAFFQKPVSAVPFKAQANDLRAKIARVDPKNVFLALASLDDKDNSPHLLGGFQFKGSSKDVDALLAPPKAALRQNNGKADLMNYQGRAIETYSAPDGSVIGTAFVDDWCLIGNDLALLKSTIDHLDRRAPATVATLDQDPDFQSVCARLPAGGEALAFMRAKPLFSRIFSLAAAAGQPVAAESRAEAEKIVAAGASTRIEDGRFRDTLYVLAPGKAAGTLKRTSLSLTSADTLLYLASVTKWPSKFETPGGILAGGPAASALTTLNGWFTALQSKGITPQAVAAALGDEISLVLDWPSNASQPALLASATLKDKAAAQKLADTLPQFAADGPPWQKNTTDAGVFYTMTMPGMAFVNPTVTVTDSHLIAGLNAADVRAAAERDKAGGKGISLAETYKTSASSVVEPNTTFWYVDAKGIFDRVYGSLRPAAMMGAALFAPQVADYADLSKLPDPEVVSRHLSPTVYSQAVDSQGIISESVGSLTVAQGGVGLAFTAGVVAIPFAQKQMGAGAGATSPFFPPVPPAAKPAPPAGNLPPGK